MKVTLKIWRQPDAASKGAMHTYELDGVSSDMSFLEMLDLLNEQLVTSGEEPVAFDSDCREGICGTCSLTVNGFPHGPEQVTSCQTYMRQFEDGQTIRIEPFRSKTFPVMRDLIVDRSALDRIVGAVPELLAAGPPEQQRRGREQVQQADGGRDAE